MEETLIIEEPQIEKTIEAGIIRQAQASQVLKLFWKP